MNTNAMPNEIPTVCEPARDAGLPFNIDVDWDDAIASRLAPTGIHCKSRVCAQSLVTPVGPKAVEVLILT